MKRILLLSAILPLACLTGCSTPKVMKANLTDDAHYYWLGSSSSNAKTIFNPTDEKVCLHVVFKPNFAFTPPTFTVEWIQPDNKVYLSKPVSTKYGSNQVLITELPIKDNEPSRLPGRWRVKLYRDENVLVNFPFTIDRI